MLGIDYPFLGSALPPLAFEKQPPIDWEEMMVTMWEGGDPNLRYSMTEILGMIDRQNLGQHIRGAPLYPYGLLGAEALREAVERGEGLPELVEYDLPISLSSAQEIFQRFLNKKRERKGFLQDYFRMIQAKRLEILRWKRDREGEGELIQALKEAGGNPRQEARVAFHHDFQWVENREVISPFSLDALLGYLIQWISLSGWMDHQQQGNPRMIDKILRSSA
ncbi:MAG: hypothetical protein VXZ72_02550 [Chlamydiota bacterium]|nr:hypothetical protein [Chlamydiota bacterium]